MSEQPAARDGEMIESVAALLVGEDLAPELNKSKSEPALPKGSEGAPKEPARIPAEDEGESSLLDGIADGIATEGRVAAGDHPSGADAGSGPSLKTEE